MENLEMECFSIISNVGTARSCFIEAITKAKNNDYKGAEELIEEGSKHFLEGHKAHFELVQKEANGELKNVSLLLVHAEDQLMSAEGFKILALEFIDVYKKIG